LVTGHCWWSLDGCPPSHLSFESTIVLAFVASAIATLVHDVILARVVRGRLVRFRRVCSVFALAVMSSTVLGYFLRQGRPGEASLAATRLQLLSSPEAITGIASALGTIFLPFTLVGTLPQKDNVMRLTALLLPLLPFLLLGDLALIFIRGIVSPNLFRITAPFVSWLTMKQLTLSRTTNDQETPVGRFRYLFRIFAHTVRAAAVISAGRSMFGSLWRPENGSSIDEVFRLLHIFLSLDAVETLLSIW